MKKSYLIPSVILLTIQFGFSQIKDTTYWNRNFSAGVNVNQAAFNAEWKNSQGAVANAAVAAFIFAKSEYVQYKHNVLNDLQLQYGRAYTESNLAPTWRKNLDRIFFDNKYAYAIMPTLGIFGSVLFQSQFDNGFTFTKRKSANDGASDSTTKISNFLSPGYLDEAAGLEWKPVPFFSARFGPVAFRQTVVADAEVKKNVKKFDGKDSVAYGVKINSSVRSQFGCNVVMKFDKDFNPNLNVKGIYQYFSAYENLAVSTHRLDAIVTAKVFKFVNVNLQAVVLYNQDQNTSVQFSEALALGIVYQLANNK
ncbi:MAG: DUF3078 domain-containing protein [Cytophagales bacterium]